MEAPAERSARGLDVRPMGEEKAQERRNGLLAPTVCEGLALAGAAKCDVVFFFVGCEQ